MQGCRLVGTGQLIRQQLSRQKGGDIKAGKLPASKQTPESPPEAAGVRLLTSICSALLP